MYTCTFLIIYFPNMMKYKNHRDRFTFRSTRAKVLLLISTCEYLVHSLSDAIIYICIETFPICILYVIIILGIIGILFCMIDSTAPEAWWIYAYRYSLYYFSIYIISRVLSLFQFMQHLQYFSVYNTLQFLLHISICNNPHHCKNSFLLAKLTLVLLTPAKYSPHRRIITSQFLPRYTVCW